MAQKPKATLVVNGDGIKPNISALPALSKEFLNDTMEPRKLVMLRIKLLSLFTDGSIHPDEQALMEKILKKERIKGTILSSDNYLLNTIEAARCESACMVKVDDAPQTHHLFKYLKCKFIKDFDMDKFIVYVPRTVPIEHQISPEIAYKRLNHIPVDPADLPKPRVLIHRLILTHKEFKAWFEVSEDEIDFSSTEEKEEYTF